MSFRKARDLCHLAMMAAARHQGITLEEIEEEFGVSHRTAQRMAHALDETFGPLIVTIGADRRNYMKLPRDAKTPALREDETLEALDFAIREARMSDRQRHVRNLIRLRDTVTSRLGGAARRAETDAEAVLSALETVARPGPRVRIPPDVADAAYDAIKGPYVLEILYVKPDGSKGWRDVEPLGVLLGPRSYLVAQHGEETRHFRMDRIAAARCTSHVFAIDENFSLQEHAAKAFSAFQASNEYGPVAWRFSPEAAARAEEFEFHPDQMMERTPDGSLIVSFSASGWLEMAWHLYAWGEHVEVLEPSGLRDLVHNWRRQFPALP